jgi:SpoVK/Ycf46/Vps4 family AAA+-type ATPase
LRRRFTLGTFFFNLPTAEERETIWGIYLRKYNVSGDLPIDEGWTGAEIKECCRKAHRLGITLTQAARYVVPVPRSAAEQIKALRQMASGKFISASTPGVYHYQEKSPASRRRIMRELEGGLTVMPPSNSEA